MRRLRRPVASYSGKRLFSDLPESIWATVRSGIAHQRGNLLPLTISFAFFQNTYHATPFPTYTYSLRPNADFGGGTPFSDDEEAPGWLAARGGNRPARGGILMVGGRSEPPWPSTDAVHPRSGTCRAT